MRSPSAVFKQRTREIALAAIAILSLAGCSNDGPAIEAKPQSISFSSAPAPGSDITEVTVSASATSGLAVTYLSTTPAVCSVNSTTGAVHGNASGMCTIEASQAGNDHYAPAAKQSQSFTFSLSDSITFTAFPVLSTFDSATVAATASSGAVVVYRTAPASATVCTVAADTGLVSALAPGDCTVIAEAGTLQAIQTIAVSYPPLETSAPTAPGSVTATIGDRADSAKVHIGSISSGGSRITGYNVTGTSSVAPFGTITATGTASPVTVTCPGSCAGYSFTVAATNAVGTGPQSAPADIITGYNVITTFYEPDTQPRDSIFIGTFTLNSTTGVVSNLRGRLSESMTGDASLGYPKDTMTWLTLDYQLSSLPVTLDGTAGLLVTTFRLSSTGTFTNNVLYGGSDGWSPGKGSGLYYGYPTLITGIPNPGNAYARIFVNLANPTVSLTPAQIDKLAYADCAPGGMMGATCMTGTTEAGYGTIGTMSGYPVSQIITKK